MENKKVILHTPCGYMVAVKVYHHPGAKEGHQYEIAVYPATVHGEVHDEVYLERYFCDSEKAAIRVYSEVTQCWADAGYIRDKWYADTIRGALAYMDLSEFGIRTRLLENEEGVITLPSWKYGYRHWTVVVDKEAAVRTPEGHPVAVVLKHIISGNVFGNGPLDCLPWYTVQICPVTTKGKVFYEDNISQTTYSTFEEAEEAFNKTVKSWTIEDHAITLREIAALTAAKKRPVKTITDTFSVMET